MKLMLHELKAAREHVRLGELPPMTPSEYKAIRPFLGQSSGFQSFQYREIEFILGNMGYLRKMLDTVLFPELWRVRSSL